jgi:multimeric flavodoxin WrbA
MKKVTAFLGTASRKHTYYAVRRFLDELKAFGDVESEIVALNEYKVGICRSCKLCFKDGEEACPLKDDRDVLIGRMMASDGVVFASPNLSFQVSGLMKVFLDRLGFAFHRPRFFGKTFTSIIAQGIYGGQKIVSYLDFAARALGFNTVKGTFFTAFDPMTDKEKRKIDGRIAKLSRRFHDRLLGPAHPVPSALLLAAFRAGRTSIGLELDDSSCDWRYYKDRGWFESDYFYPTRLGPLKKGLGRLAESVQAGRTKRRLSSRRDR